MIVIFELSDLIAGNNDKRIKDLGTEHLQTANWSPLSQGRTSFLVKDSEMMILKERDTMQIKLDGYEIEELFWYLYHILRRDHNISIPMTILHLSKELNPKQIEKLINQLERKAFEKL